MIKRTIRETVREYDNLGALLRETVTETFEEDDTDYMTTYSTYPLTEEHEEESNTFIN